MSRQEETTRLETGTAGPRRANDTVMGRMRKPPEALFDACWREGELALLFGEPGSGKSLLAVQIADAIARGTRLLSPETSRKRRQKVLYIDLVLTEKQFRERYSEYRFATDLYREAPPDGEDLFRWTAAMVARFGFKAVIIDDLTLVTRTADGTREALILMYALRRLTVETGVSILVLADTYPFVHENQSPERGLRRSRVLCGIADSVFALYEGKVVQTRVRSGERVWTLQNTLRYRIEDLANGLLGLVLEPPEISYALREKIVDIKRLHDTYKQTFRRIGAKLGISKSQAQRLYSRWTPEIDSEVTAKRNEIAEQKAYQAELDAWRATGGLIRYNDKEKRWVKATK